MCLLCTGAYCRTNSIEESAPDKYMLYCTCIILLLLIDLQSFEDGLD